MLTRAETIALLRSRIPALDAELADKIAASLGDLPLAAAQVAGYLEQTGHNVGRVLKAIEELGQLDNTLVIYIAGDKGASAEGSTQSGTA